jgi:azurin
MARGRKVVIGALQIALVMPALDARPLQANAGPGFEGPVEQTARLSIATRGSELAFEPPELRVIAGQPVVLTFTNRAEKQTGFRHNWVLVNPGKKEEVLVDSLRAGKELDYVPDSSDVLAHTRLLDPGESQTVRFTAPSKAGNYPFFCSFPGHSELLKGTLKVVDEEP